MAAYVDYYKKKYANGATPAHVSAHQGHVEVSGFLAENVAQRFLEMNC